MERKVDVAILGAGSAGLYALSQVRRNTDSFVIIDGGELGTTCARVGCMPSKAMIQVADDYHRRHIFDRHGIEGGDGLDFNLPEALEHVRDLRDFFTEQVIANSTDRLGDEFIAANAVFTGPDTLSVNGEIIRAKRIIIATGSRPVVPAPWAAFGDRVLTSDNIFEQTDLPASIAVIGLGVIGLELGQALRNAGVDVTGIDRLDTIGGMQDPAVAKVAIDLIGKDFPLWLGHPAEIEADGERLRVRAGEREVSVDKLLVSLGRTPNVEHLGLEKTGAPLDARGIPVHDPHTMRVGDLPIFIAGDVTGERAILHEAGDEGRIAGYNASHDQVVAFKRRTPLAITFSNPNLCTVGADWPSLDQDNLLVGEFNYAPLGRALIMGRNKGLLRLYVDKRDGRLLGASMAAPGGEHIAHLLAWSIQLGLTVHDLYRLPFYHPTLEEGLQAALNSLRDKLAEPPGPMRDLEPLQAG